MAQEVNAIELEVPSLSPSATVRLRTYAAPPAGACSRGGQDQRDRRDSRLLNPR